MRAAPTRPARRRVTGRRLRRTRLALWVALSALSPAVAAAGCGAGTATGTATASGAAGSAGALPAGGTGMEGGGGGTGGALPPGHPPMGATDGLPPGHPAMAGAPGTGGGMDMAAGAGSPAMLMWTAPDGWVARTPSSKMRLAEFALPHAAGDAEDASLAIYWFGGAAGGVAANVDRWLGQFVQADGRATKDVAKIDKRTVGPFAVTVVDVAGTFNAEMTPGSGVAATKTGWRMLGAIVEAPEGAYFVKAIGPQKTLDLWKASFDAFLGSLKPAPM